MLIRDDAITSDATPHTAQRVEGWWTLSWLPGRLLDRNQAITGMTIAELVAKTPDGQTRKLSAREWALLGALAGELGLDGTDAAIRAGTALVSVTRPKGIITGSPTGTRAANPRPGNGLRSESGLET